MQLFGRKRKALIEQFHREGYVRLGKLFTDREVELLKQAIDSCEQMQAARAAVQAKYSAGKYPSFETIFVMNDVFSDNLFSLACRRREIIDFISEAFADDAYLYHAKVPLKYPGIPGFKYHQDFFYWYDMGCLFPNMATCFIALDRTTEENGCLTFVPRSHHCGRMNHIEHDGVSDSEADPERVRMLIERYGEAAMTLEPGEVTVHHSNLLHGSAANHSDHSRLALLGCFNTKANSPPENSSDHPPYAYQPRFSGTIDEALARSMPDFSVSFRTDSLP